MIDKSKITDDIIRMKAVEDIRMHILIAVSIIACIVTAIILNFIFLPDIGIFELSLILVSSFLYLRTIHVSKRLTMTLVYVHINKDKLGING